MSKQKTTIVVSRMKRKPRPLTKQATPFTHHNRPCPPKVPPSSPSFILWNYFSLITLRLSKFFFLVFFVFKLDKNFCALSLQSPPCSSQFVQCLNFCQNLSLSFSKFGKTYFARSFFYFPLIPTLKYSLKHFHAIEI